jgi:small subunit ribosomal protein S16
LLGETTAVAVKIKLKRMGKIRAPYYRIIIADSRTKRDGRAIEEIGKYHPKAEPSFIEVDSDRAQHWLSVGAQPTDPVRKILEITGDWQKFKGLPGADGTLRTAEPRADKKVAFAAAAAESLAEGGAKSKPKGKAAGGKADGGKADGGKADSGKADSGKADAGRADTAKAESGKAESGKAEKAPAAGKKPADESSTADAEAVADAAATAEAAAAARAEAAADESTGDQTTGDQTTGDQTTGDESTGDQTTGDETAGGA